MRCIVIVVGMIVTHVKSAGVRIDGLDAAVSPIIDGQPVAGVQRVDHSFNGGDFFRFARGMLKSRQVDSGYLQFKPQPRFVQCQTADRLAMNMSSMLTLGLGCCGNGAKQQDTETGEHGFVDAG